MLMFRYQRIQILQTETNFLIFPPFKECVCSFEAELKKNIIVFLLFVRKNFARHSH